PFADSSGVEDKLEALGRLFASFGPFEIALGETARFPGLLYLRPEPAEPLVAITEGLVRAFPEFPPYGGEFVEIVPHVTVALAGESAALSARAERIRSKLRQAKIERRARNDLTAATVDRLESLGLLGGIHERSAHAELRELEESLTALEELQAWVEAELAATTNAA